MKRSNATSMRWTFETMTKSALGVMVPVLNLAERRNACYLMTVEILMFEEKMGLTAEFDIRKDEDEFDAVCRLRGIVTDFVARKVFDWGHMSQWDLDKNTTVHLDFLPILGENKTHTAMKRFLDFTDRLGIPRSSLTPPFVSQEARFLRNSTAWVNAGVLLHIKYV